MLLLRSAIYFFTFLFSNPANHVKTAPPTNFEDLKLGERLTLASCGPCHLGDDGKLSGKLMTDVPSSLGTIYSANITNDAENGIGNWSKEDLEKMLRTGTTRDGRKANIMMPRYKKMADSDLNAIVNYLKSGDGVAVASKEKIPASRLKLSAKMAPAIKKINKEWKPGPITKPDTLNSVAYGKYLVDDVLHCYSCHSASAAKVNFNEPDHSKGYMGGGSKFPGADGEQIVSLNLTFDKETGIENYSQQDFATTMKTGKRKNGEWLRFPMPVYPMLTNNDLSSIYQYLQTVPVINNKKLK